MDLGTLIDHLPHNLDDRLCIFAAKPWSETAPAVAVHLDSEFKPPKEILEQGLAYFLEVQVANEALEVFGDRQPSAIEKRNLLIFYAENDAFPDWVYAR
jgi:hypothetical protein